jgi:hypothetical protein
MLSTKAVKAKRRPQPANRKNKLTRQLTVNEGVDMLPLQLENVQAARPLRVWTEAERTACKEMQAAAAVGAMLRLDAVMTLGVEQLPETTTRGHRHVATCAMGDGVELSIEFAMRASFQRRLPKDQPSGIFSNSLAAQQGAQCLIMQAPGMALVILSPNFYAPTTCQALRLAATQQNPHRLFAQLAGGRGESIRTHVFVYRLPGAGAGTGAASSEFGLAQCKCVHQVAGISHVCCPSKPGGWAIQQDVMAWAFANEEQGNGSTTESSRSSVQIIHQSSTSYTLKLPAGRESARGIEMPVASPKAIPSHKRKNLAIADLKDGDETETDVDDVDMTEAYSENDDDDEEEPVAKRTKTTAPSCGLHLLSEAISSQ